MPSTKLEVIEVTTDVSKLYKASDKFSFKLTLDCQEEIEDDVEFEVVYFGDAATDDNDQRIGYNAIGPLQPGKQYFELETSSIDLTKVPIKTLFGLTTILIIGKYHGQQFIRIGYVVNVKYPGVASEKLLDSDDTPLDDEEEEGNEAVEEEEIEIMDDDELEDEEESSDDEQDESGIIEDEEDDKLDEEENENESDSQENTEEGYESQDGNNENEDNAANLLNSIFTTKNVKSIKCETPIVNGVDEFEYKGIKMKQSLIELELIRKPIIHVYEIDWKNGGKEDIVESSDENVSENVTKKTKPN